MCVYGFDHKVKIPHKHIFAVLLIHNTNPTAEKSSKNWFKMTQESSGSIIAFWISQKMSKKCWLGPVSSFGVFSRSNISATIHPISMVLRSFWISFVSSFHWLRLIYEVKWKLFKNFLLSVMPLYEAAILQNKSREFSKCPRPNVDLYAISSVCTNFEAFTTFSAIFTSIRLAIYWTWQCRTMSEIIIPTHMKWSINNKGTYLSRLEGIELWHTWP